MSTDVVLHRSIHRENSQHLLRQVIGWRIDVSRRESPKPIGMLHFQVSPDFSVVVQTGGHFVIEP
jgi:hypothetical protein